VIQRLQAQKKLLRFSAHIRKKNEQSASGSKVQV